MHVFRYAACNYANADRCGSLSDVNCDSEFEEEATGCNCESQKRQNLIENQDQESLSIRKRNHRERTNRSSHKSTRKHILIGQQSIAILLLLSFSALISSLAISPPSREVALLRLGRTTTVDDDELARTMADRSGSSQDEDEPIGASVELAPTRDLMQAQESNGAKISERSSPEINQPIRTTTSNTAATLTTTSTAPSIIQELGELTSDSQIASVSIASSVDSPTLISVINNQSSSIQVGGSMTRNEPQGPIQKQQLQPEPSAEPLPENSANLELLHNVAMDEPADTIRSLQAHSISSKENANDADRSEQTSPNLHLNGIDKREERRRKTADSDPKKESRTTSHGPWSRGSIKSVIGRPKQTVESRVVGPKFGLSTKLLLDKAQTTSIKSDQDQQETGLSAEESPRQSETPNLKATLNVTTPLSGDSQTNSSKLATSSEMRAFESSTIETTANGRENASNADDLDDDDSGENLSDSNGITTTQAPSEDLTITRQQQSQISQKIMINNDYSKGKSSMKPIKVATSMHQNPPTSPKPFKLTHHELLVGPFKSESDAPDTITLAGVVYQKSGSSSGLPALFTATNQTSQSAVAASSIRSIETAPLISVESLIGKQTDLRDALGVISSDSQKIQRPQIMNSFQSSKLLGATSQQHSKLKLRNPNHSNVNPQQWTPQALPSNTQLFLPISQAQLISLLGQPGKLLTSASQTLAQAAATKAKDKTKVSVTLTSIPTGESLLSSLASSLDLKLANPTRETTSPKAQSASSSNSLSQSILQSNGDIPDWTSSASSPSVSQASSTGTNANNDANSLEQIYLASLLQGIGSSQFESMAAAASSASKDQMKSHPVVIVEKNVKPMKYHLLRAYLKLRRLLRPADATYVFPASSLKSRRSS